MINKKLDEEEISAVLAEKLKVKTSNCRHKTTFFDKEEERPCISLLPKELKDDFYCQLITKSIPTDPVLTLYKVKQDDNNLNRRFDTFSSPKYEGTYKKYIIPIDELEIVYKDVVAEDDANFNQMTLRDYACIHLNTPQSNKGWLNALIYKQNG